jgi:Ca-activated chloride channel homolog
MNRRGLWARCVAVALAAVVLGACGRGDPPKPAAASTPPPPTAPPPAEFVVLATTDLRDVERLERMVLDATGVPLKFRWGGTMESTEAVLNGEANAHAAWFANAKYLLSSPQGQQRDRRERIRRAQVRMGRTGHQAHVE